MDDLDLEPLYCVLREKLKENINIRDAKDAMIIAANKAGLTKRQLLDVLAEEGLMGVYNLGLKHMYDYLNMQEQEK